MRCVIDRAHPGRKRKGDHQMFSPTSPNASRAQLPSSSARTSRRTTPSLKIIGVAAITLLAAGNSPANAVEDPSRLALEQHACVVAMGLPPFGDLYNTCVR